MEKFDNIQEQRLWNNDYMWDNDGHEWSKVFGNTENLWNKEIFDDIKEFRGKKILEIAPGYGRLTQFLSILASELLSNKFIHSTKLPNLKSSFLFQKKKEIFVLRT